MVKKILIFTKSYKNNGCCVAGMELYTGKWIRLVSSPSGDAIHWSNMYLNGVVIKEFDAVEVVVEPVPLKYQPENFLLKSFVKIIPKSDIEDFVKDIPIESPINIFGNKLPYVTEEVLMNPSKEIKTSLVLVEIQGLKVYEKVNKEGKKKKKASFYYNNIEHIDFSITDPFICKLFDEKKDKELFIGDAYIVVSLPNAPYETSDKYYKFIAKVLPEVIPEF